MNECNDYLKNNIQIRLREQGIQEKYPQRIVRFLVSKFDKIIFTFSGGTDSTLLLLLLAEDNLLKKIDYVVFNNTRMNSRLIMDYIDQVVSVLNLQDKFIILKPKLSRKKLLEIIEEDVLLAVGKKHSKHLYRCCRLSKELPFNEWLKEKNFNNEKTVVLRGIRLNESSQRYMTVLQMIETGQIYYNKPRYNRKIYASNPLVFMDDFNKKRLLGKLCLKYNIDYPEKSGCIGCPIFLKYEKGYDRRKDVIKLKQTSIYDYGTEFLVIS